MCVHTHTCVCRDVSSECLLRNTTDCQGVPKKGRPKKIPEPLGTICTGSDGKHCPLREMPRPTSQITAQGQGKRVEGFPGCSASS